MFSDPKAVFTEVADDTDRLSAFHLAALVASWRSSPAYPAVLAIVNHLDQLSSEDNRICLV